MPNWCSNNLAFYQEDGGVTLLEAFFADVQKYQTNESDWVGNWLQSHKIDPEKIYCRGFFSYCEFCGDHVEISMDSA